MGLKDWKKKLGRWIEDPRVIQPGTPEFNEAVETLAQVARPRSAVPNGFDAPMEGDTAKRARRSAERMVEMASELGLLGVSVTYGPADEPLPEGAIVLIEAEEEKP